MSNTSNKAKGERRRAKVSARSSWRASHRLLVVFLLTPFAFLLVGCRQDMQDQPRYEAYEPSKNFSDGLSSRPYVEGTVARGYLNADKTFYTGKTANGAQGGGMLQATLPNAQAATASAQPGGDVNVRGNVGAKVPAGGGQTGQTGTPGSVNEFPFAVDAKVLDRGQERFQIYCSMCHGSTGFGDGMIVRRGFRRPPSFHDDRLRGETVGHFFDVITNGWGAMPDYSQQIPPQDRWAIIAYIRALQLSQNTPASEVPEEKRNQRKPAPGTPTTEGGHQGETGGEHPQ